MGLSSGKNAVDALVGSSWNSTPDRAATLTYNFPRTLPAGMSGEDAAGFSPARPSQQVAARAALEAWAAVANLVFIETPGVGDINFATNNQSDRGTAAYAYLPDAQTRDHTWVFLNNRAVDNLRNDPGEPGFMVLLHEIGHTLGLKHPGSYNAAGDEMGGPYLPAQADNRDFTVMSYSRPSSTHLSGLDAVTPMLYDIQAIQYLYGANRTWHAGNDVYAFTPRSAPQCIWDAGGANTFDFSACGAGAVIDLRPGGFSSTQAGYRNVSIAYGVTVQQAVGSAGGDTVYCNDSGSTVLAGAGADTVHGGAGDDRVDGGPGVDTVVLEGLAARYRLSAGAGGWLVEGAGRDVLEGVERLRFDDGAMALDIDGVAGQMYRLYQAAFARTPDMAGLGYWISAGDGGASLASVAQGFIDSAEFAAAYGPLGNAAFVERLYRNILDRAPDPAGLAFHVGLLDSGATARNDTLVAFSESAENQAGVIGVIGNGFAYTPFGG